MQNKLFISNLSFKTADAELNALFSKYGSVVSSRMAMDRETGRARGFGFVEMSDHQAALDAVHGLNKQEFGGRIINVAISEPRERQPNPRNW